MAKLERQHIRKVQVARGVDFDEQLWPINAAVFVLAGFVGWIALATSDFHDPRILYNGWVHLGFVALMVGVLLWAVVWLQGKMVRRVQLCVLLSLLIHLWLGFYLREKYLAMVALEETRRAQEALEEPEPTTIPDYHWEGVVPLPTRQSFEEPTKTAAPAPSETEPEPPTPRPKQPNVVLPQPSQPDTLQLEHADPAEIRRVELSAPRRDNVAAGGQVSRQHWKHRPEINEPIPQPTIQPAGRELPSMLAPQVATVRRDAQQPAFERRTFDPQPSDRRSQEPVKLARRAAGAEPLLEEPTTHTPNRRLDRSTDAPQEEPLLPEPIVVAATVEPPSPDANPIDAQRQLAVPNPAREASPSATAAVRAPLTPGAMMLPSATARRAEPAEPQPTIDAATSSRPSTLARSATGRTLPSTVLAGEALDLPAAAGTAAESRLDVSQTSAIERTAMGAPQNEAAAAAGRADFAVGSTELAARVGLPRASGVGRPSVTPSDPAPRIARSLDGIAAPITPLPSVDEMPSMAAAGGSGGQVNPSADAQATAVGRVGGVGIPSPTRPMSLGLGPATPPGSSGLAGAMALARVIGDEPRFSAQPGGGTPQPARSFGRAFAGDARAELPETAPADLSGARTPGPKLQARVSGQEREMAGLPGALSGQPASGALAALSASGAARRAAAARRAVASQREPGADGSAPAAGSTLARSDRGVDLPAAAETIEHDSEMGASGVAAVSGSAASGLEVGSNTAVQRTAADVPSGPAVVPSGVLDLGSGASELAALGVLGQGAPVIEPRLGGLAGQRSAAAEESGSGKLAAGGTPGTTAGPLRLPRGDDPGPSLAAEVGSGPPRETVLPGLLRGLAEAARPEAVAGNESSEPGDSDVAAGPEMGGITRREGGLLVQIAAAPGPGGLSEDPTPVVGIPSRRARPESEVVYPVSRRFVLERSAGRLTLDGRVHDELPDPFSQRTPQRRAEAVGTFGGTEGTERAVEAGLDFLARHQFPDGRWALDRFPDARDPEYRRAAAGEMNSDTAATGLALLAFLGAGYTHQEDKHRTVVGKGLDWLIQNQRPSGELFRNETDQTRYARSYAHGIAAITLCEAYGMTRDPGLREPAERAIQHIYDAQHPQLGGWRYTPPDGASQWQKESDTSVSGWQLMALKSAQMAGLPVRQDVLDKVSHWLDLAEAGRSQYVYNPRAADTPEQRRGRLPNQAMTAEGLLMRMYLGWQRDNPSLVAGAEFLKDNLPDLGTPTQPLHDVYYWYYATQVMFHAQGDYWDAWNGRLHPLLESSQVQSGPLAGSWAPDQPVADRWAHAGGRHYVTALNILMLEVYYRHLPLFRTLE